MKPGDDCRAVQIIEFLFKMSKPAYIPTLMDDHDYRLTRRRPGPSTDLGATAVPADALSRFSELPPELHLAISSHLGYYDIYALRLSNRYFASILPAPITTKIDQSLHEEAEASYLARSYGLAACGDCLCLGLSWTFYCHWFGGPIHYSFMRRRCTGCEPQISCGCGLYHHVDEMFDYDTILTEPSWSSKRLDAYYHPKKKKARKSARTN